MTMQKNPAHPGPRLLVLNWCMLVVLTLISMLSALLDSGNWQPLSLWSAMLVLVATLFKCRQIMWVYLNLRMAGSSWRVLLACLALLSIGIIAAAILATPAIAPA